MYDELTFSLLYTKKIEYNKRSTNRVKKKYYALGRNVWKFIITFLISS